MSTDAGAPHPTVVDTQVHCVSCGYDLRGLAADSHCPECSTDVHRSLRGDDLRYADPKWLRAITRGTGILQLGLAIFTMCVIVFILMLLILIVEMLSDGESIRFPNAIALLLLTGVTVSFIVGCVGVWLMTSPEPREADRESLTSRRHMTRYGMFCTVMTLLPGVLYYVQNRGFRIGTSTVVDLIAIVLIILTTFNVLKIIAHLEFRARENAAAIRADRIARHSRWALLLFSSFIWGPATFAVLGQLPNPLVGLFVVPTVAGFFWMLATISDTYYVIGRLDWRLESYRYTREHAESEPHAMTSESADSNPDEKAQPSNT